MYNSADLSDRTVLRRASAAARLLGLRVRIPLGAGMSIYCESCVLSGRGLCDGPITRAEESYRVCVRARFVCVCVCVCACVCGACVRVHVCVVECDRTQQ